MSLDDVDLQCLFLDRVDAARRGNKPTGEVEFEMEGFDA